MNLIMFISTLQSRSFLLSLCSLILDSDTMGKYLIVPEKQSTVCKFANTIQIQKVAADDLYTGLRFF